MEAFEFKAKIKGGFIQIPDKYSKKINRTVKVIILSDSTGQSTDIIDDLLSNPVKVPGFTPFAREELYERG